MRLSNMADYAVIVMRATAGHCGTARISATQLSSETEIALPTVQKLVSLLSKAGLLRSVRGARGGIQLARPAAAISLADIVEAIEGPIALTQCAVTDDCECKLPEDCPLKPHWRRINDSVRGALCDISLDSLTQQLAQ